MSRPDTELTEKRTTEAAREALVDFPHSADTDGLALIRIGSNAVYRLADELVVRVTPPEIGASTLVEQIKFADWLETEGIATSRPLVAEPVEVDGLLITFWEFIPGSDGASVPRKSLGRLLRRFHEVTNGYQGPLPKWEPLGRMGERLQTVICDESFTEEDRAVLCSWRDLLVPRAKAMDPELQTGPIHGDFHSGNIVNNRGVPFVLDFDRIARGPREWDLSQIAASSKFFGMTERDVDEFMIGYGWDPRALPDWESLVQLRGLFMTTWLATIPRSEGVRNELESRMSYWRDPSGEYPDWSAV